MLAQDYVDLFFDAVPHLEYVLQSFELSTKAAFAKAVFDTPRVQIFGLVLEGVFGRAVRNNLRK